MNTINEDIELAKLWHSNASHPDGKGDGWRHTCYRLAAEVERLREENKAAMKTTETIRIAFDFEITYSTPDSRAEAMEMALECEHSVTRAGCFGLAGVKLVEKSGVVLTPPAK